MMVFLFSMITLILGGCDLFEPGTIAVDSLEELDNISVLLGTSKEEAEEQLAEKAGVTFTDGGTKTAEIAWQKELSDEYNPDQEDEYNYLGLLTVDYKGETFTDIEIEQIIEVKSVIFRITEMIVPEEISVGSEEYVEAKVKNIGSNEGTQDITARLSVGGLSTTETKEDVTLEPGETLEYKKEVEIPDDKFSNFLIGNEGKVELKTEDDTETATFLVVE